MLDFKKYIGEQLLGKRIHFKCQCMFPIDFMGVVRGYKFVDGEIIWKVERENGKIVDIGMNHPNMTVEEK